MEKSKDNQRKPYVGDTGTPIENAGQLMAVSIPMVLLACAVGFVVGVIVWGAFMLSNVLIRFLWTDVPAALSLDATWWPLVVCPLGGLVIGLWTLAFRNAPESLDAVMGKVHQTGGYKLRGGATSIVSFLLPLAFGGSIGPEAGLSGIIAAACTWISNTLKRAGLKAKAVADLTISATLSAVFATPLLGMVAYSEQPTAVAGSAAPTAGAAAPTAGSAAGVDAVKRPADKRPAPDGEPTTLPSMSDYTFRRPAKLLLYTAAAFGAFGGAALVGDVLGASAGLPRFESIAASSLEYVWCVPLALLGWLLALLFHASNRAFGRVGGNPNEASPAKTIALPVVAGFVLGACALALPDVLFAGETQCHNIMESWGATGVTVLLATGAAKVVLTPLCLNFGWRGGNFFPCIFAGVSFGYGIAAATGLDPMLCVVSVTTALVAGMCGKPVLTIALLILCFPIDGILVSGVAAVLGAMLPVPRVLKQRPAPAAEAPGSAHQRNIP